MASLNEFGIDNNGQILFELYQHYGFTDSEEQLIIITRTKAKPYNLKPFPISDEDRKIAKLINIEKYTSNDSINYKLDINDNADLRNNGYIYNRKDNIRITTDNLFYSISKNNRSETLIVYNANSNILLIESKKQSQ